MPRTWFLSRWLCSSSTRNGNLFDFDLIDHRPGIAVLRVSGKNAFKLFQHEAGGHRWQRIPKTEKRGRVHTSTVTCAILPEPTETSFHIPDKDLEWKFTVGSGAGGQHRNKTCSAAVVKHLPTGLMVRCESERSQHQNKASALALLRARLLEVQEGSQQAAANANRRQQVGSGMRGDKVMTLRSQDNQVIHHITGKRTTLDRYLRGYCDDLI